MQTKTAVYRNGVEYTLPTHTRFITEIEAAGLGDKLYMRKTFIGCAPALRVKDRRKVLDATTVPCEWDGIGLDVWVGPVALDRNLLLQQTDSWGS